tara:strand:+ start:792 stop:1238 length:447 start_codon:yes stop_codon:yes gene_type:complete
MDLRKVKKLIELAEESDLAEIEVSGADESVRIVRNRTTGEPQLALARSTTVRDDMNQGKETPALDLRSKSQLDSINSPMAGTFYAAPSPDEAPFVEIGQEVVQGEVVCIIESMKMMHEIKSPRSGEIMRLCVNDGEPVGTADPLFEIR